jgi:hypothetical protein
VQSTIKGGDVRVSPGTAITGVPLHTSFIDSATANTDYAAEAVSDHANFMSTEGKVYIQQWGSTRELGGMTFKPGTYRAGTAFNVAYGTEVILDAENVADAEFIFIAGTTLVTAAGTEVKLINGAKAENIIWALGTAATLGAGSIVEGSILAGTAITFGAGSKLHGCAIAQSAVTFESAGTVELPWLLHAASAVPSNATIVSSSNDVCGTSAIHAQTTITFAGGTSIVGAVGVSPGTAITGNYIGTALNDTENAAFADSVLSKHTAFMETETVEWMGVAVELGGETKGPGIYRADTAFNLAHGTNLILDAGNATGADAQFIFIAGTTLVTAADTSVILINGAKAENIIWALGTAATLGTGSLVQGSILAGTAITFGTGSTLHGCALAQSAVTFAGSGTVGLSWTTQSTRRRRLGAPSFANN